MRLDVNALGTFHRMAREGAGLAAGRLTHMTDVETRVGVTKLNFMRGSEIRSELDDGAEKVGVRVRISGGLDGDSVIVFDRASAFSVLETLLDREADEFDELTTSAMVEVGQIMNNGFIDGWADVLETAIDVDTPELIRGTDPDQLLDPLAESPGEDDLVLLFQSTIEAVGTEVGFRHYLFPEQDSMASVLARQGSDGTGIEYDKLAGFDRMAQRGASEVADTVTALTGIETDVEIRKLNFVPLEAIPEELASEMHVAVAFEFEGMPSGFLIFLFDEESAREVVRAMVPDPPEDEFDTMGQSAIKELGNIMASGFLDGWANVLDTNIDHSTPEYIHDIGAAAVDPLVIQLGENQEYAFVFDTRVKAADRELDCDILAIPDESDLERALNDLDVSRIDDEPIKAEFPGDT